MLLELRVENLLLIERAELRLGPGLNAITGETGAGKTMLAHALDLLLGGRPRSGIVRPGAPEAYVEGVFSLPAGVLDDPDLADVRERIPDGAEEVVLARRVGAEGRSRAFVGGRSAAAADLRELGGRLVAFYGQHEHRRLTVGSAQLDALDRFCGPAHLRARERYAEVHLRAAALARELEAARGRDGSRDRELDLLAFEIDEIAELGPSEQEEAALRAERERLRRLDALRAAAAAGAGALAGDAGGVAELVAEAERLADAVAGVDPELDALAARLRELRIEADDLGVELRRYESGLEGEPGRLEAVEERLAAYERLERKHGGSVAAVLAHLEDCQAQRERLTHAGEALEGLEAAARTAEAEAAQLAGELSAARRTAAPGLGTRVQADLRELAMEEATFSVTLAPRDARGASGADQVEFLIAPNPGVGASPLRDTASGGELSRAMLALMSVASAGGPETLVFDEVDAGIGGQTARAVGERLRRLAQGRQVLCITHLPQIASLADRHFRIAKGAADGLARTEVAHLDGDELVAELCRMLGADSTDEGARRHAQELLAAA